MARSLWKGPYIDAHLWNKIEKEKVIKNNKKNIIEHSRKELQENKIWSRRSMIWPGLIGKKYQVYTGNKWKSIVINEEKVGHLFGEFIYTKQIAQFKRKSKLKSQSKSKIK